MKGHVLILQGNHEEGVPLVDQVAQSDSLTGEIIDILQDTYLALGASDKLSRVYERVAARNSKNENFLRNAWFSNMINMNDYSGQQKATMALYKLGKRQYTMWAVFCLYMAVKSGTASKTENMIFPQLATRFLEGAKPLQNAQEGYLQALVLQIQKNHKSLAEFLTSDQVKTWDLLDLNVMIPPALEEVKDWEGLKVHCENYLVEKNRDDWNHWTSLIKAHTNLGSLEKALEFAQNYKKSRNSLLAVIELAQLQVKGAPTFNEAVETYFNAFATKRSTFPDLIKYTSADGFDRTKWTEFLNKVDSKDMNARVNVEKFKFAMRDTYDLEALVAGQIKLYEGTKDFLTTKDPKDYHPGDDYLLIASSAILEQSHDVLSLKKAAVLLELAAKNDKHQFFVRLWLVRIYILLGAFSLAKAHYQILKVSKIQHESLAHFLVTRMSSLSQDFDTLYDAYEIYESSANDLPDFIWTTYEHNSFTQLESMNDLHRIMKNSVSRGIIQIEMAKSKRFSSVQRVDTLATLKFDSMADSRDFSIMWDIPKAGEKPLSEELSVGPKIGTNWVKVHQLKEDIIKNLIKGGDSLKTLAATLLESSKSEELTKAELWSVEVIHALALSALDKSNESGYSKVLTKIDEAVKFLASTSTEDWWQYFHARFVAMETLIIASGYLDLLTKHQSHLSFNQAKAVELRQTLETGLFAQLAEDALAVKNKRSATVQAELDAIIPWFEKLGLNGDLIADIANNVVEGAAASQDLSLTALRAVKL